LPSCSPSFCGLSHSSRCSRLFVFVAGRSSSSSGVRLKGAVPILLGALAVLAGVEDSGRIYGIIFVVVLFSVLVQGSSITFVAKRLHVPFRTVDHDLVETLEFVVAELSFANGRRIEELPLAERAWIGILVRDARPRSFGPQTVLEPGDRVQVYGQPETAPALRRIFAGRSQSYE